MCEVCKHSVKAWQAKQCHHVFLQHLPCRHGSLVSAFELSADGEHPWDNQHKSSTECIGFNA